MHGGRTRPRPGGYQWEPLMIAFRSIHGRTPAGKVKCSGTALAGRNSAISAQRLLHQGRVPKKSIRIKATQDHTQYLTE